MRVPAWIVAAALAPLPFLYGAVHPVARATYVAVAAVLLLSHVWLRTRAGKRVAPEVAPVLLAVAALLWAGLALIPLPAGLLHVLAPQTWQLAIGDPAAAGLGAPEWHPIAVTPEYGWIAWATGGAHLAIFVVALSSLAGRRGARTFAAMLAATGTVVSILAILQSLLGAKRIFFVGLERAQFYGTFVNGNHTATFLGVCSLAALGLLLRERDLGRRMAAGVAAVVCAAGVLQSLSRGGTIAFVIGLAVFLGGALATQASAKTQSADEIGRFFRRHGVLLMLLGLSIFYISWLGPRRIGREIATLAAVDLPSDYRAKVWRDSSDAVRDWPLTGAGAGGFGEVFPIYRTFEAEGVRTEMAESEYVQATVEIGIVGAGLLVLFGVFVLGRFAAAYFADPMRFSGAHLGFCAGLVLIAAHIAFDFPLRLPAMGAITAALAGSLVGALHQAVRRLPAKRGPLELAARRLLPRPARREGRLRDEPGTFGYGRAMAWAAVAPVSFALLLAGWLAPESTDAAETILRRPADARAWVKLARSSDERVIERWEAAVRREPSNPALQRAAAIGFANAGDPKRAVVALQSALAILETKPGPSAVKTAIRLDLAEQRLWSGDAEGAAKALEAAGDTAGPRAALLRADLLAARAGEEGGTTAEQAIEAYIAAMREAGAEPKIGDVARGRALLLTVNSFAALEDTAEIRRRFDRLGAAGDAGLLLRDIESLGVRGDLDVAKIWGGPPTLRIESFEGGEPRLRRVQGPGEILEHAIAADGTERLSMRYPSSVIADPWAAVLPLRTRAEGMVLRLRAKAPGRAGEQLCAYAGATKTFGTVSEPDAGGWRTFTVPVTGAVDGWCFDTRGRSGVWEFDEIELAIGD